MNQPYPGQPRNGWQHLPPQPCYGQPYPPGHHPPPPTPKRKKTGLWVLLALLAVIVVVAGGVVAYTLYANRDWTVTFEVTGTGTSATIRYWAAEDGGNIFRDDSAALPWAREITLSGSQNAFVLDAFPATEDDTVTCSATVNGQVIVTKTASPGKQVVCLGVNPDARK
ncbi:hypothetical protein EB74_11090 [Mycobacterium sp. SWH-M5]|uniref:Mycobacterium membrane protein n=1 Tax=Mycolicibacterium goodii TaxID=134601 RepID=A0ABS6HFT0_MYCGD|nr:hypothetical protein [Mycolicibacterium goodii]MBU8836158.1 hypothetical protein [Mycolicibacterium goodii]OKH74233.1 hypothetical protein EB74_11090 [Mycobacterium sp. SWH-M5]